MRSSTLLALTVVWFSAVWLSPGGLAQDLHAPGPRYAPDLDQSLFVGSVEITRDEIRRHVIYGPGRAELEYQEDRFLIEQQLGQNSPGDHARWLVPEREFEAALALKVADFDLRYPTLDLEAEVVRAFRSMELYKRKLRGELLFDQVFVPDDPKHWPAVTFEALREEAGEILIDDFAESYRRRAAELNQRLEEWDRISARPALRKEDSMYRGILRTIVREHLLAQGNSGTLEVRLRPKWVSQLLSPFDGRRVRWLSTAELWQTIEHSVTSEDLLVARRFLATVEATKQRLAQEGHLLPWEEAMTRWQPSEVHASVPKWGPYREAELSYAQLYESFRESITPALNCSAGGALTFELQHHLERVNVTLGLGKVDMEVLPVLAFDMDAVLWKPNGWALARSKAERLAESARRVPYGWDYLLEAEGEYWNPPAPTRGRPCSTSPSRLQKGTGLSKRTFNDLRKILDETDYTEFTSGHSVVRPVFFDGVPGEIYGPLQGNRGFYLLKVIERTDTMRPLDLNEEKHLELLRDSYATQALLDYSRESLVKATVRGRLEH